MKHVDPNQVAAIIEDVADEHILPYFRQLKADHISFKSGDDPVTIADQRAESALSSRFLDLLPGSKVVGEEAFAANRGISRVFLGDSPVWIIDPVDGTRNFVKGSSEFGVIVALAKRNQIIAGWIYDPTSRELITVEKGSGAYTKGHKLKVLAPAPLSEMLGCLADSLITAHKKASPFKAIQPDFELMACAAHEYGRLMLNQPHFGKDKPQIHFRASRSISYPWDDAAGVLMHLEAGGYSATWAGHDYSPTVMDQGLLLAPDKDSWNELAAWFRSFCDLPSAQTGFRKYK